MTCGVHAELSADGKSIILAFAGDDFDLDAAAAALKRLTADTKPTDPPSGMRVIPATWANVTQLASTFNGGSLGHWLPRPRLREWITSEFLARCSPGELVIWPGVPGRDDLLARPYQVDAAVMIGAVGKALLFDEPGPQPLSARVLTPAGWTTMGAIRPGDEVTGTDGHPYRVLETYDKGTRPICKVTFSDGAVTRASEDHLWAAQTYQMRARVNDKHQENHRVREYRFSRGQRWLIKKTSELKSSGSLVDFIPVPAPVEFSKQELPLHPYVLGALLGDGALGAAPRDGLVQFTTSHAEFAGLVGLYTEVRKHYGLQWGVRAGEEVHALGLAGKRSREKFIPGSYLHGSREQREFLLHGLMDSDGRVSVRPGRRTRLLWSTTSRVMRDQFTELVRSLGGTARVMHADTRRGNTCWTISLELPPGVSPFRVSYKAVPARSARTEPARSVRSVEPDGSEQVKCLLVDAPDHLYITDDYVVTSNTGKTVSAVLGLRERQARGHGIFPLLIVTPSWDVGDVWARHIANWTTGWPPVTMYSGPERAAGDGVLITTYATMRLDAADAKGPLVKLRAKAVVFDESHGLKNTQSKQSQAGRRVAAHAETFIALSGTPVTRDTGDIYPVLAAMDPQSWPSRTRFVKRYCETADNGYGERIEGLRALAEPEFRAVLAGQYRRVAKADVLSQLPPKVYSVRRVEIPPEYRKPYDQMQEDMLAELPDGTDLPVMSVLAQLTRLSQLASAACDVTVTTEVDEFGEEKKHYEVTLKAPSWKADALLGILAERPGQQVAVFTVSKQLALVAAEACTHQGYRIGLVLGGQSRKERQQDIDAFQAGELDLIICTAGAGSLGITLTRAGTVVALQRSWELDKAIQIEDRAHRLDDIVLEHDCIEVIDVIARDTIEDRVRALMRVKGGHLGQLVGDPRIVRELLGGLR